MEVTKTQIDDWKRKHGDVFEISVEGKTIYVKKPDRKTISYATVTAMQSGVLDPVKFSETILNDCFLSGDEDVLTNDDLFLSIMPKIEVLTKQSEVSIKKL